MSTPLLRYWAFRVDRRFLTQLDGELQEGRLRQGWGSDPGQDLRAMTVDAGAGRNRRMFNHVKRGDRILIPHLPHYGQITIAEATVDWNQGYDFSIWNYTGDHGHIFPARFLRNFHRSNAQVPASLRGTFRNPSRFWNVSYLRDDIERVLATPIQDLSSTTSVVDRWHQRIADVVRESGIQERLFREAQTHFSKSEWEYLLSDALQRVNPSWKVQRRAGRAEVRHGTDILVTIPDVFGDGYYGIAIQVKDYAGFIGDRAIDQILKAKEGYWQNEGIRIVELVVVLTGGDRQANPQLEKSARNAGVRLIWSADVEELILRAACRFTADPDRSVTPTEVLDEESNAPLDAE